ncbi:hypothetical protein C1X30_34140, partial [Pseudomonas sp. FW305-BF6]|uniref:DUF2935 domain-containing protein n=1 Tax=Pseudomonas sp. FW305-BF6 TaxID=2070673 RepID=UPI000CCAE867
MSNLFVSRSLDEILFWSRIMKEHSLFLKLGFNCDDTELIHEADQFYKLFEAIETKAQNFTIQSDPKQIQQFNIEV